ncbi:MAG TPA: acyl-CoA dehydrogenase family protein [Mycobacteriales bacterium]|nr:acyl-CoA dehydrogenase family protein [Mycobacteriales bacterium]
MSGPAVATLPEPSWDRLASVAELLSADAADHDERAVFPAAGIDTAWRNGLLTATVGTQHGGAGAGVAATVDILEHLGYGDPSVALISAMTLFTHAAQAEDPTWPAEYYQQLLRDSAERPTLVNALRVEPDLGTPARGGVPATTARRTADGWALSGHKIFSTGAIGLDWMVVWARTDEDPVRVGAFLVRGASPGIEIRPTWDHLGLRASRSDDVLFTDVPVPLDATVGLGPVGTREPVRGAWNSLGLAALYLGVARAARDWLVGFLHERVPSSLGKSLATLPRMQSEVGEIDAALLTSRDLVTGLAVRADAGDETAVAHAPMAKLVATRAAIAAVERAVALVGNNGLTRNAPLQRHLRDVLCSRVHTPQDDAILAATGKSALFPER